MDSRKKVMWQTVIVSGAAAGLAQILHHPLFTLKSQMMYHGKNFNFREFLHRSFVNQPAGILFLYRGLLPRTLGVMPEKAFKMIGWNAMCEWLKLCTNEPTISKLVVAGAVAGAATALIGCPSERAMVLAQVRKQGFSVVVQQAGLRGLYLGWTATLYREITFNIVMFTIRELKVHQWKVQHDRQEPPIFIGWMLGIPAGIIAAIVACPFDVAKTRMQGKELGDVYKGCSTTMLDIIRREGPRYLFKGLGPRLISVPSMMAAFFAINFKLSTKQYQAVRKALKTLKPQWRNIGLALEVPLYKLNEYTGTDSDKMDKMLEDWLNETFNTPTWGALVAALSDPDQVPGGIPVAREIKANHGGGGQSVSAPATPSTIPSGVQLAKLEIQPSVTPTPTTQQGAQPAAPTPVPDLAIIEQPKSIEKHPIGLPVEFSVKATGPADLVYLWKRTNGKPLDGDRFEGKDSPCLKIKVVKAEDEGSSYQCTVSSGADQVVSKAASLTIEQPRPLGNQIGSIARSDQAAQTYLEEVKVLLHVANENELKAMKTLLEPPQGLGVNKLVQYTIHPKAAHEDPELVYLAHFGGFKTALLQTEQGDDSESPIRRVLSALPHVKVLIAVGVAYGVDPEKQKLGDVLVSDKIIDGRRVRFQDGCIPIEVMVPINQQLIKVFCQGADGWMEDEDSRFECSEQGRYANAWRGSMISGPWLVNNEEKKRELIAKSRHVVGGEMEGCYDNKICNDAQQTHVGLRGVVIIKGLVDYADGSKGKVWQPIAAKAAGEYAKYRLTSRGSLL